MNKFYIFALISGVGFLLDMTAYIFLIWLFDFSPVFANIASSFLGVSFVWFVSLRKIFNIQHEDGKFYLIIYWMYQTISILAYSSVLGYLSYTFLPQTSEPMNLDQVKGIAKIIITPFNLVTNYLFMRYLTNHIKNRLAAMPVLNINSKP